MKKCSHSKLICINPYELIRKYKCKLCYEVMICECEKEIALKFLPHQIKHAQDLNTREEVPVTLGFQKGICNKCRGLPEKAYPKAELYGAKSKIKRYYWREIHLETIKRFGDWAFSQGYTDWLRASIKHKIKYNKIRNKVIEEIKKIHETNPKYIFSKNSQQDIITECEVEFIKLNALYLDSNTSRVTINYKNKIISVEEYVSEYLLENGYLSILTESRPFHVLFGVFNWILIQDPVDPKLKMSRFGNRFSFKKTKGDMIWTLLPKDFGTIGYFKRRLKAIHDHISNLAKNKNQLFFLFDYWLEPSYDFRNYLWAHQEEDIEKARKIIEILPIEIIKKILLYLLKNYWNHYLGWPDILAYNECEYFFVEVKSSKDKLSVDQKRWIKDNHKELNLPFKMIKVFKE